MIWFESLIWLSWCNIYYLFIFVYSLFHFILCNQFTIVHVVVKIVTRACNHVIPCTCKQVAWSIYGQYQSSNQLTNKYTGYFTLRKIFCSVHMFLISNIWKLAFPNGLKNLTEFSFLYDISLFNWCANMIHSWLQTRYWISSKTNSIHESTIHVIYNCMYLLIFKTILTHVWRPSRLHLFVLSWFLTYILLMLVYMFKLIFVILVFFLLMKCNTQPLFVRLVNILCWTFLVFMYSCITTTLI